MPGETKPATDQDRARVAAHLMECGQSTICATKTAAAMPDSRVSEYCRRLADWQPADKRPVGVVDKRGDRPGEPKTGGE